MLDARAMAVGEQVTPTEFRALPLPPRYREDTPTECCNPTHYPWMGSRSVRTVSHVVGMRQSWRIPTPNPFLAD